MAGGGGAVAEKGRKATERFLATALMTTSTGHTFVQLRDHPDRAALCHAFYDQVYAEAFPNPDESEDCDTWLPLLDSATRTKPHLYILLAVKDPHDICAGIVFEWYADSKSWLITYLAVGATHRGHGLARSLIDRAIQTMRAAHVGGAGVPRSLIFAETEDPTLLGDAPEVIEGAYRRIATLEALGFARVDITYVQPALAKDKQPVRILLLLAYTSTDELTSDLDAAKVAGFIREFYDVLGGSDSADLRLLGQTLDRSDRVPLEALSLRVPTRFDETLGRAGNVTVQLLYFDDVSTTASDRIILRDGRLDLKETRRLLQAIDPEGLLTPADSYYEDIFVPFVSEKSRPIVLSCEPFGDVTQNHACRAPLPIWIDLPAEVTIGWESQEQRRVIVGLHDDRQRASIAAQLIDYVAIFESGIVAYGMSLRLRPDEAMQPLNATEVILLESLSGAAGSISEPPTFRLREGESSAASSPAASLPLDEFIRSLMRRRSADRGCASMFSRSANGEEALPAFLATKLEDFAFGEATPSFIAVEIVGADRHDDVLRYADLAKSNTVPVDHFSKRLAGMVQNVLDFDRQDSMEVQDSLLVEQRLGSEITFVSARTMIWFSRYRRSYLASRRTLGADPYWLMTRLVLGHNEQLLLALGDELDALEDEQRAKEGAMVGVNRRLHTIQRRLDGYVQNPFRYRCERSLFDFVSATRRVEEQRRLLQEDEQTLTARVEAEASAEKEQIDGRINLTLIAIGVVQIAGIGFTVLSLRFPPEDQPSPHYPVYWIVVFLVALASLIGAIGAGAVVGWRAFKSLRKRAAAAADPRDVTWRDMRG